MHCSDRELLETRYRADLRVYLDAARRLDSALLSPDFSAAQEHANQARRAFEDARSRLKLHIKEHACLMVDAAGAS